MMFLTQCDPRPPKDQPPPAEPPQVPTTTSTAYWIMINYSLIRVRSAGRSIFPSFVLFNYNSGALRSALRQCSGNFKVELNFNFQFRREESGRVLFYVPVEKLHVAPFTVVI